MDVKDIKCPLEWWRKHEAMFPTVRFLGQQILGIVVSQIEIEMIFYLAEILTNLRRCLQIENFREVDFCQQKLT